MQTPLFSSVISRTECAGPDLPPLPPPGATPAPPPQQEPKSAAAAPPPPPPDATTTEAPPPPPPTEGDSISRAAAAVGSISNPGPFEQASSDARRLVMLDTHDGFRCDINKQLSPYMAVVHSFWLGTTMIPDGRSKTYSFLTQVADETGLLMARVDPERGSVDGRIHKALLGGAAMAKVQLGVSAEGQNDQLLAEIDFGGQTWTGNVKYGSMGGGLVYGMNYFQSLTPSLAVGAEGMYLAANQSLLSNYTVKYSKAAMHAEEEKVSMDTPSTLVANYNMGQHMLTMNYKRVITPNRVTVGAELQCAPLVSTESQVSVGAEFKLTRSRMQICVDGSGKIQSTLESKLGAAPGSPSLNFSAELDHSKEVMRFGYGLNIEG
jgi:mitochondrial import receptor subunit TOM40